MQEELRRFFDTNESWLTRALEQGRQAGELSFWGPPQERARVFLGALEGAMLVARSYKDHRRFRIAAEHLLADLTDGARLQGQTKTKSKRRGRQAINP
jgi:TetR/AcrR family transcriptional repressor of nem operon